MADDQGTTEAFPASAVRAAFSDMVNRVTFGKHRVVITRHDRAVAALVPIEDLRRLERDEAEALPPEAYERIRRQAYEQAWREVNEQLRDEARRKLESMVRHPPGNPQGNE